MRGLTSMYNHMYNHNIEEEPKINRYHSNHLVIQNLLCLLASFDVNIIIQLFIIINNTIWFCLKALYN